MPVSGFLMSGPPGATPPPTAPAGPPAGSDGGHWRGATPSLLAGVGVLLLAMGVGVLIGRAGGSKASSGAPQVISVASTPSSPSPSASEAAFTSDWPSATGGYTVQLQTLAQEGTSVAAVQAAKSAATAKGAKYVGALSSEEFPSLPSGQYVVYSGVFHEKAEAQKALAGLKGKFPSAKVIRVSSSSASSGGSGGEGSAAGSGSSNGNGSSLSKPAPPSVLEGVNKAKGKGYVEKAKNLPDVVSTG